MEKPVIATLEMMRMRREPMRSASVPVTGAENAEAYVRKPRNSPAADVVPPSARMWNGAVGSSWNAERKTVNEKPHITKKRGVNRRSGNHFGTGGLRPAGPPYTLARGDPDPAPLVCSHASRAHS